LSPRDVSRLLGLALAIAAAGLVSIALGAADIPLRGVIATLTGGGDETTRTIVVGLRLPRAALALLVGGALGLAGAVYQALLRNPLAEPFLLGVSGGAAMGAVSAVVLGWNLVASWSLPLAAFVGALFAIALVLYIASRAGPAVFWMMGSLAAADWPAVVVLIGYVTPAVIALLLMARPLNTLAMGEETALYLGTRVERVKLAAYVIASLLVAAAVAVSGVVGFVGLVVPHAIRLVWGSDHQLLLPASTLAGGGFLLVADTVARTAAAPAELPVGVITALIGVPIFVVLLIRKAV
jgi:iron complex transport system permease protein